MFFENGYPSFFFQNSLDKFLSPSNSKDGWYQKTIFKRYPLLRYGILFVRATVRERQPRIIQDDSKYDEVILLQLNTYFIQDIVQRGQCIYSLVERFAQF